MAEISDFHRQQQQTLTRRSVTAVVFEEDPFADLCTFDFESISPPFPSSLGASTPFFRQSDYGSNRSGGSSIFFGDEDDDADQMSFISELFSSRRVQLGVPDDRDSIFVEVGSQSDLECTDGLRVTGMGSESDSEALEVVSGAEIVNNRDEFHDCDPEFPGFWDCLEFHGNRGTDESEWEEVNERENISSVIERIEEIALSSEGENLSIFNGGEGEDDSNTQNLEWQVLLAANNLEIFPNLDGDEILHDFVEIENSTKGSPPASKHVVENLPLVVLSSDYLKVNSVVCAVCKDEISVDEKVTKLPCSHHYHMPCIVPWLRMRNTCPVCRYEFPTDDVDYERTKNGRGGGTGSSSTRNFNLRYNYHLLP